MRCDQRCTQLMTLAFPEHSVAMLAQFGPGEDISYWAECTVLGCGWRIPEQDVPLPPLDELERQHDLYRAKQDERNGG